MPKKFNGLSDWVLSYWFATEKSSHASAGNEGGVGGAGLNRIKTWGPILMFPCPTRVHLVVFPFFIIYSIDSSKMMGSFLKVSNFNRLFLKVNWFICNYIVYGI